MFEFNPGKRPVNAIKHGIDIVQAQALWDDECGITIPSARRHYGEDRALRIASLDDRIWTAIVTDRGECIRIISVRRARNYEEEAYEQARQYLT